MHFLVPALLLSLPTLFAQKILMVNLVGSRSQVIWNARIADALSEAGMDVLILEAEFGTRTRDMQPVKLARRRVLTEFNVTIFREFTSGITFHTFDESRWPLDTYAAYGRMLDGANYQCEELLKQTEVLEELKAEKFDVVITGMLYFCGAGLKEVLGIEAHVGLNSSPMLDHIAWVLGMPLEHSYVPAVIGDLEVSDDMTYFDRLWNFVQSYADIYLFLQRATETTKLYRRYFGPNFPDVSDIVRDSALLLVCVDELVDFPRPLLPNVVYIGGVGMGSPSKDLPKEFEAEMSKGRSGTVFFSLGTGTDMSRMPGEFLRNVFRAFDQFPDYHFIFKGDDKISKELASNRSNVHLTAWTPQNDLLAHPRMRGFVSHGGYNSLLESAKNGVPILVMPFYADQFRNAQLVQRNGWGIAFDKRQLLRGPQEFVDALRALLTDERYARNATRVQRLLRTKPFSPEERLARSLKFVADNGGNIPELQSRSRLLSFFVYQQIDILITLVAVCAIVGFCIAVLMMRVLQVLTVLTKPSKVKAH